MNVATHNAPHAAKPTTPVASNPSVTQDADPALGPFSEALQAASQKTDSSQNAADKQSGTDGQAADGTTVSSDPAYTGAHATPSSLTLSGLNLQSHITGGGQISGGASTARAVRISDTDTAEATPKTGRWDKSSGKSSDGKNGDTGATTIGVFAPITPFQPGPVYSVNFQQDAGTSSTSTSDSGKDGGLSTILVSEVSSTDGAGTTANQTAAQGPHDGDPSESVANPGSANDPIGFAQAPVDAAAPPLPTQHLPGATIPGQTDGTAASDSSTAYYQQEFLPPGTTIQAPVPAPVLPVQTGQLPTLTGTTYTGGQPNPLGPAAGTAPKTGVHGTAVKSSNSPVAQDAASLTSPQNPGLSLQSNSQGSGNSGTGDSGSGDSKASSNAHASHTDGQNLGVAPVTVNAPVITPGSETHHQVISTPLQPQPTAATPASTSQAASAHNADALPSTASTPLSEAQTALSNARLIQNAGQTEMHVGLRTQEFGDISIRTSTTRDVLSAQIRLDHADLAKTLTAHLPEMQARLGGDQNVNLRIHSNNSSNSQSGSFSGGNDNSGNGSRNGGQQANDSRSFTSSRTFNSGSSDSAIARASSPATAYSYATAGRLDIRA